jgi:hypothetical protein
MKLFLEPLLKFLDDPGTGDNRHASAIIGFLGEDLNAAAFAKYLEDECAYDVTIINESPRPGTRNGKRLDRWIHFTDPESGVELLYQCEIKNWAASAIGGYRLPVQCSKEDKLRVAKQYWKDQLRNSFGSKTHPNGVTKVFMPMKIPEQFSQLPVVPLLVYWMPVAPQSLASASALFNVPVASLGMPDSFVHAPFDSLTVFSVSLYFRELLAKGCESIELHLPGVERRMQLLSVLVPDFMCSVSGA